MSHFNVVVALESPDGLADALAPFDENKEVEPYRNYKDGAAADHWLYGALKRADEDDRNGTGMLPYRPDELGWSSSSSKDAPEVQRGKIAANAALFRSLPSPVTWADIVELHNARYGEDSDPMLYDELSGRAYQMSTYNPDSKWDWYQVGGRWTGHFRARRGAERMDVIYGQPGFMTPANSDPRKCDGGPKRALDLKARWLKLVDGIPEARPWREFADLIGKVDGYGIDRAREEYGSQPRVQAIRGTDYDRFGTSSIETYQKPERQFVELQRAQAVPGFALLTLEGRWMAPGRMGWFGSSSDSESDRAGYYEAANAYIESLSDSTWLIAVDCHI